MILNPIDPSKAIIHRERILTALGGGMPPPVTVGLDISNRCGHRCVWCLYERYKREKPLLMPEALAHKAVREMAEAGVLAVCFSGGGEPGMNPALGRVILACRQAGLSASLNTNGERLRELGEQSLAALSYVRVSLDAGSAETHRRLHRPAEDCFERILDDVAWACAARRTTVGIGFLAHPLNYREFAPLAQRAGRLGCAYLQVRPVKGMPLDGPMKAELFAEIEQVRRKLPVVVYESFTKMEDTIAGRRNFERCVMNRLVSNIGPDGCVYACCELRGVAPIGDIGRSSFKDIWFSEEHRRALEGLDLGKCPACKYAKGNEIIERVFVRDELHRDFL
ncbi:MAG: radical SAM protein [Elusimicrobiota bacterium]